MTNVPMEVVPPERTTVNCRGDCERCCGTTRVPRAKEIPTEEGILEGVLFEDVTPQSYQGSTIGFIGYRYEPGARYDPHFQSWDGRSDPVILRCKHTLAERKKVQEGFKRKREGGASSQMAAVTSLSSVFRF